MGLPSAACVADLGEGTGQPEGKGKAGPGLDRRLSVSGVVEQHWCGGKTIPENARLADRYCNNLRPQSDVAS